jgi:hypothetical protein
MESAGLVDAALAQAEAEDRPLGVQLAALSVLLDGKLADDKRSCARSAGLQLLNRIVHKHPENGYLAAGVPLLGSDVGAPLTQPELAILDEATKRPRFELPIRPLFESFEAAYEQVDPGQAYPRAFSETAGAVPLGIHLTLSQRAAATSDPGLRSSAAAVLIAAGSRLEAGATFLERMIGLSLQTKGAELGGDRTAMEAVKNRREHLKSLMATGNAFWAHPLPIPSLLKDHFDRNTADEVRYYEAMTIAPGH